MGGDGGGDVQLLASPATTAAPTSMSGAGSSAWPSAGWQSTGARSWQTPCDTMKPPQPPSGSALHQAWHVTAETAAHPSTGTSRTLSLSHQSAETPRASASALAYTATSAGGTAAHVPAPAPYRLPFS